MTLETVSPAVFLLGRLLFGGVLAIMGLNHFQQADQLAGYAASKGVPAPKAAVLVSGGVLVLGGGAIAVGIAPVVAAAAIVAFFAVVTPTMHDFWTVDDPEARQSELTDFLKNVVIAGGALALLAIGGAEWPLAVGL